MKKIFRKLTAWLYPKIDSVVFANQLLAARINYLEYQVSRLQTQGRHLAASAGNVFPEQKQTLESFDYQWDKLPVGRFMIQNEQFKKEVTGYVLQFTGLPEPWFKGKKVLDAGCGQGRYSWGLSKLGAKVTAVDHSDAGLRRAKENCAEFPDLKTLKHNLLEPLPFQDTFDLVWSFGVLHHTGNTYKAFRNIVPAVKPGGYLFLMLYGEPREGELGDYKAVNEYERLRFLTRNKSFEEKIAVIREEMAAGRLAVKGEEHVHGYFDAISPAINDLYQFSEIQSWLIDAGFEGVRKTVDTRNLHIIARKKES